MKNTIRYGTLAAAAAVTMALVMSKPLKQTDTMLDLSINNLPLKAKSVTPAEIMDPVNDPMTAPKAYPYPAELLKIEQEGAWIEVVPGSLREPAAITIDAIPEQELPKLDPGMVNVTPEGKGYRMLPHGTQFNIPARLAIPYDSCRLPAGFSSADIRTYYYNEQRSKWVLLPREQVDPVESTVISATGHFTDFINSVIKVPEAPQTNAYTPNSIKDLKVADPLAGHTLISPPSANNMGSANISYPIEIPAGRQGMQPSLALTYSSSGGNGWLGMGWSLEVPAITIDTRWGVPWYDSLFESETYLLNGAQLTTMDGSGNFRKLSHQADWIVRLGDSTRFYRRVEGAFEKILRHGTCPENYWWEVVSRDGTKYFYGKSDTASCVSDGAVIRTINRDIGYWPITEVVDISGNTIKYQYSADTLGRRKFYLRQITYTGFKSDTENIVGQYNVIFYNDTTVRPDINSSSRLGFDWVVDSLLASIIIQIGDSTISGYCMAYTTDLFGKSQLCAVAKLDSAQIKDTNNFRLELCGQQPPQVEFVTRFKYHSAINTLSETWSDVPIEINTYHDVEADIALLPGIKEKNSPLGTSTGNSIGGGLALLVGFPILGGNVNNKRVSLGGNYMYSRGWSLGNATMVDIDGDGLIDKVYRDGNSIYFRKQLPPDSTLGYRFSAIPILIQGIDEFQRTVSNSHTGGFEAQVGISADQLNVFSASYAREKDWTRSKTKTYFTDFNADGIVDLVKSSYVFINQSNASGIPVFDTLTADSVSINAGSCYMFLSASGSATGFNTPGTIVQTEMDNSENLEQPRIIIDTIVDNFGPEITLDAVKVWIAPYSGSISIKGTVRLDPNTIAARNAGEVDDGVKIFIQHSNQVLDTARLQPNSDSTHAYYISREVARGDRVYFRIHSLESRIFDKVIWDPIITYNNINLPGLEIDPGADTMITDADDLYIYSFAASEGFLVSGKAHTVLPEEGIVSVRLSGEVSKPLSDLSSIIVKKNQLLLYEEELDITSSFPIDTLLSGISVDSNDIIEVYVITRSRVDCQAIRIIPEIFYTSCADTTIGTLFDTLTIPGDSIPLFLINATPEYLTYPNSHRPTGVFTSSYTGSIQVTPNFETSGNGSIFLTIKKKHETIYYEEYTIQGGYILNPASFPLDVEENVEYYFDYVTTNLIAESCTQATCLIDGIGNVQAGVASEWSGNAPWYYGPLYRGWGQFTYNYAVANSVSSMNENFLKPSQAFTMPIDTFAVDTNSIDSLECKMISLGAFEPMQDTFLIMVPDVVNNRYIGFTEQVYVGRDTIANTYLTESSSFTVDYPDSAYFKGAPIKVINLETRSKGISNVLTVGVGNMDQGWTKGMSESAPTVQFIDVNGDRYPDLVGSQVTRFSKPQGGLSQLDKGNQPFIDAQHCFASSINYSVGNSVGTSYTRSQADANASDAKKANFTVCAFSNGSQTTVSRDTTHRMWLDINGDGLPDRVSNNGQVYLNLGYRFQSIGSKAPSYLNANQSLSTSLSIGINQDLQKLINKSVTKPDYSLAVGFNGSASQSQTTMMVYDINGDGLNDLLKVDGTTLKVIFNTGNGFSGTTGEQSCSFSNAFYESSSHNAGTNVAFTAGFPVWGILIKFNPKIAGSWGSSRTEFELFDMDGDGMPDLVEWDPDHPEKISVRYNQIGKTGLLEEVVNSSGSSFSLDYTLPFSSYENPNRQWVLSSVKTFDGHTGDGIDSSYTTFTYAGGQYNRYERDFLGYAEVVTSQHFLTANYPLYRKVIEKYHNQNFLFKGLKYLEQLANAGDSLYSETCYQWVRKQIENGTEIVDSIDFCFGQGYPAIKTIKNSFFEGQSTASIITIEKYVHGSYGNVTSFYSMGDINDASDGLYAMIEYDQSGMARHLVSNPISILVYDSVSTALMRKRTADYDSLGRLTAIHTYLDNDSAQTDLEYDIYGNLAKITYPPNGDNERFWVEYTYDSLLNSLPVSIVNAFELSSSTIYDPLFQVPLSTTDQGGSVMNFTYDSRGRLLTVQGPKELADNVPWTIRHNYYVLNETSGLTSAVTEHYDPANPSNHLRTVIFSDGNGKVVQTKKDAYVGGAESMVVSGKALYDEFSRITHVYYPTLESDPMKSLLFSDTCDPVNPSATWYDVMDRKVHISAPDSSITLLSYGFGTDGAGKIRFMSKIIDALGNSAFTLADYRSLTWRNVAMLDDSDSLMTDFAYDAIGQLISSTDPDGLTTTYSYDMMGRRISRTHPDAGTTTWTYDKASNLSEVVTANLDQIGAIQYSYDYNRIVAVTYPEYPINNVLYIYGEGYDADGNLDSSYSAGRLVLMEDATGVQEFEYGSMGEIIRNRRTFAVPENPAYTFETQWDYDSWGRAVSILYPDGEQVNYSYDLGGLVNQMTGQKGQYNYQYVDSIAYDKFSRRSSMSYGNGTIANYFYDDLTGRLQQLVSLDINLDTMQSVHYTFDDVGNITSMENRASVLPNGLGGNSIQSFGYDGIYRLISSNGEWNDLANGLEMIYSPSGMILTKTQTADLYLNGNASQIGYSNDYTYVSSTHKIESMQSSTSSETHTFSWDANGNMLTHYSMIDNVELNRSLCWDEENRLRAVSDNNALSYYLYNAGYERAMKISGAWTSMQINKDSVVNCAVMDDLTLYTSPYLVIDNQGYTKHYFVEGERITSKIGGGQLGVIVPFDSVVVGFGFELRDNYSEKITQVEQDIQSICECLTTSCCISAAINIAEWLDYNYQSDDQESQQYFYHPDHLGSSSFISDASGEACQFLAYLPYGEQWVDQRSSGSYDAPYKFSGKELDAETGYNYFGARYYDSGLSVWLNVDPLNDKSANGNPYSYCEGTPIGSIDINGLFKWDSKLLSDRPRLRSFLENELQSYVRDNPAIVNNLVKYGQFANAEEALKGLKNGEGPDILVIEDPCNGGWMNNNAFAMGCVDKGNPDAIEINSAIIDLFEYALPEDLEAVKFALVSVLTHEYVDQRDASLYYGKGYSGLYDERTKFYMDIDRNEYPKDLGHLFEQKAFGYSIGYGTAEMGPAKNIDDFKQRARDYIDNEVKP